MKKIVMAQEVDGEGFEALLGDVVVVFCMNYIYSGLLAGVNDTCILLTDAHIVYETGKLTDTLKDSQPLPSDLYIQTAAVESFYKRGH